MNLAGESGVPKLTSLLKLGVVICFRLRSLNMWHTYTMESLPVAVLVLSHFVTENHAHGGSPFCPHSFAHSVAVSVVVVKELFQA